VVENYLKKEFESFAIAHQVDTSHTHTFTVDNGKKRFTFCIGWPILADRSFTPAKIDHLLREHVAEEMRLHEEAGCHWAPSRRHHSVGAWDRAGSSVLFVLNVLGRKIGSNKKAAPADVGS
jgi:hypothetical protein